MLGEIYLEIRHYEKASIYLRKAHAIRNSPEIGILLGRSQAKTGDFDASIATISGILSGRHSGSVLRLALLELSETLLYMKAFKEALQAVSRILQANMEDADALLMYSIIMLETGQIQEAVKVLLRLITKIPDNKRVQDQLARSLDSKAGYEYMLSELRGNADTAAAFAFLATICKDHGVVGRSVQLYEKALSLSPASAIYALNKAHSLEIEGKTQEALDCLIAFMEKNESLGICGLTCNDMVVSLSSKRTPSKSVELGSTKVLSQENLELLGIFFTVIKMLYLLGRIAEIRALAPTIASMREGRDLHLTSIRNEQAYFSCIHQLLEYQKDPSSGQECESIYVFGDSHSLSPAWQILTIKGKDYVLKPVLVTGLKMWHLRPESRFYTKTHFYNMAEKIPDGAKVVVVFGEIDCREGFLLAVEKGLYENIEEAAATSIDIFITALNGLQKKKNLSIYVHPVVPVLNETRHIVKIFNPIYQKRILTQTQAKWLDFFGDLLDGSGSNFHAEYSLDGTHINPKYLQLIEKCLEQL
eukprot:TRINITY_DN6488_c0_g1_i1.p1 TRINITY_DN6488_c0_g1~~TRINITY_DN6488_c0_g1_i1.p1  ORF type:complete len:531 (+),score=117.81 TRINITY_DN6488_c0_g1_i1:681-2273(+)